MKAFFLSFLHFLARWNINERGVRITITFPDRPTAYHAWEGLKADANPLHPFEIHRHEDMKGTFLGVPFEFVHDEEKPNPRCDARPRGKI